GFAGGGPGGVGDPAGIGADVHAVVGQRVDAVVRGCVFEHVLDPPPGPQPVQQPYRGGGGVAGQHLQDGRVVLVQGELAGGAVPLDLHHLGGEHHVLLLAAAGDGCLYGGGGGGGQWWPPVADPLRARLPAGGECGWVGPAPGEAEQDRGIWAQDLAQLGQHPAKVGGQPRRLTGGEDHGPAAGVHHQGVVAAGLGVAAFGVPALGDRLGSGIGHEVVVDEVHRVGGGIRGEHPRGEHPL